MSTQDKKKKPLNLLTYTIMSAHGHAETHGHDDHGHGSHGGGSIFTDSKNWFATKSPSKLNPLSATDAV